jgi:hypothetical protein
MIFQTVSKIFSTHPHPRKTPRWDVPLTAKAIKEIFTDCSDFNTRELFVGGSASGRVTVCFIDGLTDGNHISEAIIRPLTEQARLSGKMGAKQCIDAMLHGAVYSCNAVEKSTIDDAVDALTHGFALVVFDRERTCVAFEAKSSVQRSISEPQIEKTVNGAKDGFVERIRTNTMLVRRKLCTPALKIRRFVVGRQSLTEVDLLFVENIADMQIVNELAARIQNIDIDGMLATGNLEEYICDNPHTPFPQVAYTERADRFAMNLLDGRIGLLVDGLPMGYLVPSTIPLLMRVPEVRTQHYSVSLFFRLLRYMALFIAVMLPALYVAIAMFHQEMIPRQMLLSIIQSKQAVPFPSAVEITGMLLAFELLQEAGFRLPNPVGETVGIIGALIVGQSAVEAKVVSPIAVIIVAVAGITGYTIPNQDLASAMRLCRFILVVFAIFAGLFGVMVGVVIIVYHLSRLESFGVPYLGRLADGKPFGAFDTLFGRPISKDKCREFGLKMPNRRNQR